MKRKRQFVSWNLARRNDIIGVGTFASLTYLLQNAARLPKFSVLRQISGYRTLAMMAERVDAEQLMRWLLAKMPTASESPANENCIADSRLTAGA